MFRGQRGNGLHPFAALPVVKIVVPELLIISRELLVQPRHIELRAWLLRVNLKDGNMFPQIATRDISASVLDGLHNEKRIEARGQFQVF